MKSAAKLLLALLIVFLPAAEASAKPAYKAYATSIVGKPPAGIKLRPDMEAELNRLVNEARVAAGRRPLTPSPLFRVMARAQAIDMVLGDFVGHNSVRGEGFSVRFNAFADGVVYAMRGENAARDRQKGGVNNVKAARLFKQWMGSSSHRRNLMTAHYVHVSTGAVQKGNHLYAVQIFWTEPLRSEGLSVCNIPALCSDGGIGAPVGGQQ